MIVPKIDWKAVKKKFWTKPKDFLVNKYCQLKTQGLKKWGAFKKWLDERYQKIKKRKDKILNWIKKNIVLLIAYLRFVCRSKGWKIFGSTIWAGLIACWVYLATFDLLGVNNVETVILWNYFFIAAGVIGTILTIIFAISASLIQKSIELYSSSFYTKHIFDWRDALVFLFLSTSTVGFFLMGLFFARTNQDLFYSSILILIACLLMIVWHYYNVIKKINPQQAIAQLSRSITKAYKAIQENIRFIKFTNNFVHGNTSSKQATHFGFFHYQNHIQKNMDNILEITGRLGSNNDNTGVKLGLLCWEKGITDFFLLKKGKFIVVPDFDLLFFRKALGTDFITTNLEELQLLGKQFIREKKLKSIRMLLNSFVRIAEKIPEIEQQNFTQDNEIFTYVIGWFRNLTDFAAGNGDMEVIFEAAKSYRNLAVISIQKNWSLSLSTVEDYMYDYLPKVIQGNQLNTQGLALIIETTMEGYVTIIRSKIGSAHPSFPLFERSFQKIIDSYKILSAGQRAGLLQASMYSTKPIDRLKELVQQISEEINEDTTESQKDRIYNFLEKLADFLRNFAVEANEIIDHMFLLEIGFCITEVQGLIQVLRRYDYPEQRLDSLSTRFIVIPLNIMRDVTSDNHASLAQIINAVFVGGIYAIQSNKPEILARAISTLSNFAHLLRNREQGWQSSECMEAVFQLLLLASSSDSEMFNDQVQQAVNNLQMYLEAENQNNHIRSNLRETLERYPIDFRRGDISGPVEAYYRRLLNLEEREEEIISIVRSFLTILIN